MFLKHVFIRFYKSFNFDYLRKFDVNVSRREPWEAVDDLWYPFVRIPIDEKITTIVGANESGKSHSLTAIEKGVRGSASLEMTSAVTRSSLLSKMGRCAGQILDSSGRG